MQGWKEQPACLPRQQVGERLRRPPQPDHMQPACGVCCRGRLAASHKTAAQTGPPLGHGPCQAALSIPQNSFMGKVQLHKAGCA